MFINLDYAFKVAKGRSDKLFGGVTLLMGGNFTQCKPTGGQSLIRYVGITAIGRKFLYQNSNPI